MLQGSQVRTRVGSGNDFINYEHKFNIPHHQIDKLAIAKYCWENDHNFYFDSAEIICRPNSIFELDFLETFSIHKNHNNVLTCDFIIPLLSGCWKNYIKSNLS